ncbi:MAG: hypothetical protein Q8N09_04970 [Thermodesulfovibrionia bacterium]|nr:hypothetical protein [Thermodesulfovibrionia bacterium]
MSLIKCFPISLLFHLLLISISIFTIQRSKSVEDILPKNWVIDVNIVLMEQELQLPSAGSQALEAEPAEVRKSIIAEQPAAFKQSENSISNKTHENIDAKKTEEIVNKGAQEQIKKMQEAFVAKVNAQLLMIKTKAFFRVARSSIRSLVNPEITSAGREVINDSSANITIGYNEEGSLKDVEISSESDKLKAILERVNWKAVPLPFAYLLRYKGLNIRVTINNGSLLIGIEVTENKAG